MRRAKLKKGKRLTFAYCLVILRMAFLDTLNAGRCQTPKGVMAEMALSDYGMSSNPFAEFP